MGARTDGEGVVGRQLGAGAQQHFDAAGLLRRELGAGRRDLGVAAEGGGKGESGEDLVGAHGIIVSL